MNYQLPCFKFKVHTLFLLFFISLFLIIPVAIDPDIRLDFLQTVSVYHLVNMTRSLNQLRHVP